MSTKKPKPTLFVLNKDKTVTGTSGHTIEFKKGEPTHVPREMWADVQAVGADPVEDLPEEQKKTGNEPADAAERELLIFAAFEQIVLANERNDFSGTGVPHAKALEKILGFRLDNKERDALWTKFKLKDTE